MSYSDVNAELHDRPMKKIANNTWLEFGGDMTIVMRLYGYRVARFTEGYVQLWSAGHYTTMTKSRLNLALAIAKVPYMHRVFQRDWVWYLGWYGLKPIQVFFDGIKLNYLGEKVNYFGEVV